MSCPLHQAKKMTIKCWWWLWLKIGLFNGKDTQLQNELQQSLSHLSEGKSMLQLELNSGVKSCIPNIIYFGRGRWEVQYHHFQSKTSIIQYDWVMTSRNENKFLLRTQISELAPIRIFITILDTARQYKIPNLIVYPFKLN